MHPFPPPRPNPRRPTFSHTLAFFLSFLFFHLLYDSNFFLSLLKSHPLFWSFVRGETVDNVYDKVLYCIVQYKPPPTHQYRLWSHSHSDVMFLGKIFSSYSSYKLFVICFCKVAIAATSPTNKHTRTQWKKTERKKE